MAASKIDIRRWFRDGKAQGATHIIAVRDTFDNEDYPVFVYPGQSSRDMAGDGRTALRGARFRVMEVYAMHLDMEAQLAEQRAFHHELPADHDPVAVGARLLSPMLHEEANEAERRGSVVFASAARLAIRALQRPETITDKDLSQAEYAAAVAACEAIFGPPPGTAVESAAAALQTDAERVRFLDWLRDHWCLECGTDNPRCQCWNDE